MDEREVQRRVGALLGRPVTTAPVAVGPEAPLVVTPAVLAQMAAQIAAIDDSPWRAVFEPDGDLVIWFHANLARAARRILVSMEDAPSANERAAAAFLVHSREYCTALVGALTAAQAERDALRRERDTLRRALGLAPLVDLDSGDVRRTQGGTA